MRGRIRWSWERRLAVKSSLASFPHGLDLVAQGRCFFVSFVFDRLVHFALHALQLGHRALFAHFLEPLAEELDFGTLLLHLGILDLRVELANALQAFLDE